MICRGACIAVLAYGLLTAFATVADAAVIQITISNIAFPPAKTAAHVGDTVEWVNKDFVVHTATARNGDWDVNLPPNKSGRVVLKKSGKIEYYCRYHPTMKSEIDVSAK
jgi:plastocyanin